jgi:CheY-like chemotaxis protein
MYGQFPEFLVSIGIHVSPKPGTTTALQCTKGDTGMKVLVIEHEQKVLARIEKILTQENYQVDCCANGDEGVSRAINESYDLVFTGMRMPEAGGMRILRDIKRVKPAVPVVMITGNDTLKSAVQALQLGATNFIEKSFTPEVLINTATVALKAGRSRAPEEQRIINREELLHVLERAAHDNDFVSTLRDDGADALKNYALTGPEKLAILTGDIPWIEEHVGELNDLQKRWIQQRLSAEIW